MFFLLIGLVAFAFICWPSLYGNFVLDDFSNLEQLDSVRDSASFWNYTLNGISSTLGRPISLFTFAGQSGSWPTKPFDFKLVNLVLHLLNTILVYLFLSLLIYQSDSKAQSLSWLPAVASLLWLFAPVHASTVFYVIQRMTLLSATFTLVGLICFLFGRMLSDRGKLCLGLAVAAIGMAFGYLLGVLSKENAILLGVYVLLANFLVSQKRPANYLWRVWLGVFAWLPLALFAGYLLFYRGVEATYGIRDFNVYERLLTESIILWEYLRIILLPTPQALNLYNDGYVISRSIFDPISTIVAVMLWLITAGVAYYFRKRTPYLSFGVFWFLGGHVMESTVIGLELYFEHRNYLPSLGPILFVVVLGQKLIKTGFGKLSHSSVKKVLAGVMAICLPLVYVSVLRIEALTWGSPERFAKASVRSTDT